MPEWIKAIAIVMTTLWLIILILTACYWVLMIAFEMWFKAKGDDEDEGEE